MIRKKKKEREKNSQQEEELFDVLRELKIISTWGGIVIGVTAFFWKVFNVPTTLLPFIAITTALLIVVIVQYKKIKILEKNAKKE